MTGNPKSQSRIVVGIDGSEQSRRALSWAVRMSEATGASVDAVIAWHYPVSYGWSYVPGDWSPEGDAKQCVDAAIDAVFPDDRPPQLHVVVSEGAPAKVLLDASAGATLLVVGSRGHGGFAGLMLGSVSVHCVEHAKCPVLVVRGDQLPPA